MDLYLLFFKERSIFPCIIWCEKCVSQASLLLTLFTLANKRWRKAISIKLTQSGRDSVTYPHRRLRVWACRGQTGREAGSTPLRAEGQWRRGEKSRGGEDGWVGMEGGREERGQASSAPIQLHPHTNPTIATVLNVVVGVWVCLYACVCLCVSVCVCVRSHTPFVVALLCDCLFQYVIGLRLGGC